MKKVIISTETTSDLPSGYIEKNGIRVINMLYTLDGEDYGGKTGRELDGHAFFERMRDGGKTQTAQVTPEDAKNHFSALLREGDVLHITILSGSATALLTSWYSYFSVILPAGQTLAHCPQWIQIAVSPVSSRS